MSCDGYALCPDVRSSVRFTRVEFIVGMFEQLAFWTASAATGPPSDHLPPEPGCRYRLHLVPPQ